MANDKFDVKLSFTNISFATLTAIFANILKENPGLLVGVETEAGNLNLHSTDESAITGAAGKVVPLEPEKTSKKKSAKSETKSSAKPSKGGKSEQESTDDEDESDDEEVEKEEKTSKKSSKTSKTPSTSGGTKSSGKSKAAVKEEAEDEEDEDEESEMPEPVQVPERYDMAALKQLIADINDNGHDVLDEVLEYFEVKSIKDLEKSEIKPFYKKMYKVFKEAESADEDGE